MKNKLLSIVCFALLLQLSGCNAAMQTEPASLSVKQIGLIQIRHRLSAWEGQLTAALGALKATDYRPEQPQVEKESVENQKILVEYRDPLAVSIDDYGVFTYVSDEPMAICTLFPDAAFASGVAHALGKHPMDVVSIEEMAAFTGELHFGPGNLKSVEGIGYLTGITIFSSCKNDLRELPAEIKHLKNLKEINLSKAYSFEKLPPEIGELAQLEILDMSLTNLQALPPEIGNLKNLKELTACFTQVTTIPWEIGNLTSLERLDLHSNPIDLVPDSLCNLVNLKWISLSYTNIQWLPKNFGNLSSLETAIFFDCNLKKIPESACNLTNLKYFNVYNNYELDEDYKLYMPEDVYRCKNP